MIDLTQATDVEKDTDYVPGASFAWDSNIYEADIDMAYMEQKPTEAVFLVLTLKKGKRTFTESICVMSGKEKGKKTYYVKNGVKRNLPGFSLATQLCMTTLGKTLNDVVQSGEKRMINVYDFNARKEVPTEKFVVTELLGQQVCAGIIKELKNKKQQQPDGSFKALPVTKETNHTSYFFFKDTHLTVVETEAGDTEPKTYEQWVKQNVGVTKDSREITDTSAAAQASATAAAPTPSVF